VPGVFVGDKVVDPNSGLLGARAPDRGVILDFFRARKRTPVDAIKSVLL
jgi:hypothetical protein